MPSSTCFKVNLGKVASEMMDDEVIIINLDTGTYYSLKKTGIEIWSLIEQGADQGQILDSLLNRYAGEPSQIETGVTKLLKKLQAEEIILPMPEAEGNSGLGAADAVTEKLAFEMPMFSKYEDMQDLLTLDPIHQVDDTGWPARKA